MREREPGVEGGDREGGEGMDEGNGDSACYGLFPLMETAWGLG